MTSIVVVSDIHSDVVALRAALGRATELGCERLLCAGDAVDMDMPAGSDETISLLGEAEAVCIRGNHERWVLDDQRLGQRLTPASVAWLRALEPSWSATIEGVRVVLWHASVGSDMSAIDEGELKEGGGFGVLLEAEADLLIVGHVHEPMAHRERSGVILRPGALGVTTVEAPWRLDRETGKFVQGERSRGTFALVTLPEMRVEIIEVRI